MLGPCPKLLSDMLPTLNVTALLSKMVRWLLKRPKKTASLN